MRSLLKINNLLVVTTAILGLAFCSLVAVAQPQKGEHPRGHKPGPEHLVQMLGIDEQNKDAFITLMNRAHEKRRDIRHQYRGDMQGERAAMDAMHVDMMSKLSNILNDEQLTKFEQFVQSRKPPRRHGN